jgi:hypothetical protein
MSPTDWFVVVNVGLIVLMVLYMAFSRLMSFLRIPQVSNDKKSLKGIRRGDALLMRLPKGTRRSVMTITSCSNFLIRHGETQLTGLKDEDLDPPLWTNTMYYGPEHGEIMRFVVLKGNNISINTHDIPVTYGRTNLWAWLTLPGDAVRMERIWHSVGNAMS